MKEMTDKKQYKKRILHISTLDDDFDIVITDDDMDKTIAQIISEYAEKLSDRK